MDVYENELLNEYNALGNDLRNKFNQYVSFYNNRFGVRQQTEIVRALYLGIDLDGRVYNPETHHADMHRHRIFECGHDGIVTDNDPYWVKKANELLSTVQAQERHNFIQSKVFMQSASIDPQSFPEQGWKLHLSAESRRDYYELLRVVISDFIRNNVAFKIVRPEQFLTENTGTNIYGKEITIYPDKNFDASKLSPETINKMVEFCGRMPASDKNFHGRINGRFGRFKNGYLKDSAGRCYVDERTPGVYAPSFVEDTNIKEILNWQQILENRLRETGDYRMYIQEYLLGMISNENSEYQYAQYCFDNLTDAKRLAANIEGANIVSVFGYHFCAVPVEREIQLDQAASSLAFSGKFGKLGEEPNYLRILKEQAKANESFIDKIKNKFGLSR